MAKKFYGVRVGRNPGVYNTWDECKAEVDGFTGAIYKGFSVEEDAARFVRDEEMTYPLNSESKAENPNTGVIAYVDGSYLDETKEYSCGVVIIDNNNVIAEISEKGSDINASKMRNVAGEIFGSRLAIEYCLKNNIKSVTIYHDYIGIAAWPDLEWKANNEYTQEYRDFVNTSRAKCDINFIKVKGHSGVKYNEMVDELAKQALGIKK